MEKSRSRKIFITSAPKEPSHLLALAYSSTLLALSTPLLRLSVRKPQTQNQLPETQIYNTTVP